MTQRQLAAAVEIDVSYLSKIENGTCQPPAEPVISRIATILNVNCDELLAIAGRIPADVVSALAVNARKNFGAEIRELRLKQKMSQGTLSAAAGINTSYLSKIENGQVTPPSEKVIIRLAECLKMNPNDLLITAGRIPEDLMGKAPSKLLKIQKAKQTANREKRSLGNGLLVPAAAHVAAIYQDTKERMDGMRNLLHVKELAAMPVAAVAHGRYKFILPVLLVIAISCIMLMAPSAQAVTITISPASGTASLGSPYNMTVTINVQDTVDQLPIQSVELLISNNAGRVLNIADMPIPAMPGSTLNRSYTPTGAGTVSVAATGSNYWGVVNAARFGYGYGYQAEDWTTYTPLTTGFGYGYGYETAGDYTGPTSVTYTITWTPPSNWPTGTYNVQFIAYGDQGDITKAFKNNTAATITMSAGGSSAGLTGGGGTTTTTTTPAGTTDVSGKVDSTGRFTAQVKAQSQDKNVAVVVAQNTIGKVDGNPISEITVTPMDSPPTQTNKGTIGLAYDLGPDGATFNPAITLTFTYDPKDIPAGVEEENLTLAVWNGTAWVELSNVHVDPETNTITGETTHFTEFAIIAGTAPADIVGSSLSITPAEINAGEAVKVSFTVTNEGDLSGQEDIILLVNGVETANQSVTLVGGESQELTFSTTRATGGTYSVEVAGLKGSFTVKGAAPAASPTPTVEPTSPVPTTPVATTPATTAPAQTPPEPEPMNVMMIVLIAIAAVIVVGLLVWYAMKSMR